MPAADNPRGDRGCNNPRGDRGCNNPRGDRGYNNPRGFERENGGTRDVELRAAISIDNLWRGKCMQTCINAK